MAVSILRIDTADVPPKAIAATIDRAVLTVCPEACRAVPHTSAEGLWRQGKGRLSVEFYPGSGPHPPYVYLASTRSAPVVAVLKGAVGLALFKDTDITTEEALSRLSNNGKSAAQSPDLPEPVLVRIGKFVLPAFLLLICVMTFLGVMAVTYLMAFRPNPEWSPDGDAYLGLILGWPLAFLLLAMFRSETTEPRREWPTAGAT